MKYDPGSPVRYSLLLCAVSLNVYCTEVSIYYYKEGFYCTEKLSQCFNFHCDTTAHYWLLNGINCHWSCFYLCIYVVNRGVTKHSQDDTIHDIGFTRSRRDINTKEIFNAELYVNLHQWTVHFMHSAEFFCTNFWWNLCKGKHSIQGTIQYNAVRLSGILYCYQICFLL